MHMVVLHQAHGSSTITIPPINTDELLPGTTSVLLFVVQMKKPN